MNITHFASPRGSVLCKLVCAIAAVAFVLVFVLAAAAQDAAPAAGGRRSLPDPVALLTATPGVLGVETARTTSGKEVIFAWFENKRAVVDWFYSDAHQAMMRTVTPGASSGRQPLAEIADDSGPILAIASITISDEPQVQGVRLPVSQIAIELYGPLPGGLAAGGRFAPSAVKVRGLIEAPASK